ncbi:MAG: prolipoprotein diacylglyceryl transferase, partial [Candidatus Omnitrophica bacterium]|nr:prolipoprotein diacylglyceryl transferase [Candidatus Omnitrophota bacterium]
IHIFSYGLLLVLALFTATFLAEKEAARVGISTDLIWNIAFISIVSGIIGARIFYVLENIQFYSKHTLEIILLQHGGLSWFGGLGLGLFSAFYYMKKKSLPVVKMLDFWAPYLALAHAIGRIGCLLNGCCYGRPSPYGIYFPVHDKVLIPIQMYSSLALLSIFIILRLLQKKPRPTGFIIYTYLFLYSIERFIIEFFRADNKQIIYGLTLFQIIAAAIFLFSAAKLFFLSRPKVLK